MELLQYFNFSFAGIALHLFGERVATSRQLLVVFMGDVLLQNWKEHYIALNLGMVQLSRMKFFNLTKIHLHVMNRCANLFMSELKLPSVIMLTYW